MKSRVVTRATLALISVFGVLIAVLGAGYKW